MKAEIKEAYDNIKQYCDCRLKEKYPAGVPKPVKERYARELKALKDTDGVRDFEIFMNLSREAKKASQLMFLRGIASGSLLVYLVNDLQINPLPAHYYCGECGHYEEVSSDLYGIDLPQCDCPKCGKRLSGDGMNLPEVFAWGAEMNRQQYYETNVSSDFYPFAKRVLQKMYPNNHIELYGISWMNPDEKVRLVHGGFVILPEGRTIDDYQELITYLDDGTRCMTCSVLDVENYQFKRVPMCSLTWLDIILYMQNKTGIYYNEIGIDELRGITYRDVCNTKLLNDAFVSIADQDRPKTFKKLSDISASTHNTYDYEDGKADKSYSESLKLLELIHSEAFKKFPIFTREDIYDHLRKMGYDEKTSFAYQEMVRKGILNNAVYRNKQRKGYQELLEIDVPADFRNHVAKVKYLFPRAHAVEYMWIYYLLAYYMKQDARTYNYHVKKLNRV